MTRTRRFRMIPPLGERVRDRLLLAVAWLVIAGAVYGARCHCQRLPPAGSFQGRVGRRA